MKRVDEMDVLKFFFPPEEQKRLTLPAANDDTTLPGSVDWQVLEQATCRAWEWLLDELVDVARVEGRHNFLKSRGAQVRSSLTVTDYRSNLSCTLSSSTAASFGMRGKRWNEWWLVTGSLKL
jgi:hypothetical protein